MSLKSKVTGRDVAVLEFTEVSNAKPMTLDPVAVQVRVNKGPISGIVASPDGRRLMVTNYGGNSISIIDTDICRVVGTVADVDEPFAIAMGEAATQRAYVTAVSPAYDSIQVLDLATNTVVATHPLALSVSDLTVSADGKRVYASRNGARNADVAVLDTTTDRIEVIDISTTAGTTAECVRVSPDGHHLYVGVNGPSGGQLIVIDTGTAPEEEANGGRSRWRRKGTKTPAKAPAKSKAKGTQKAAKQDTKSGLRIVETIDIDLDVRDVAISPNGALVYVASSGPKFAVIDVVDTRTNTITSTRKIAEFGGLLTRLTISGDGERAYLVSDESVTMLCTLTQDVIDTVNVATQPSCVVESRDGKHLYIADYSGAVTVAPIAANVEAGEPRAIEAKRSVDLFVPDLLQYDAALV